MDLIATISATLRRARVLDNVSFTVGAGEW